MTGPEQDQRQRDELAGKQQHPSDNLHQADELHVKGGAEQGQDIGRQGRGAWGRAGS